MKRAIQLAKKGLGNVSPNPLVGAVIVKNDKIIGEGWHKKFGGPHAEVFALEAAGEAARGADMYVSLEPCSHIGKTPACAPQIVEAGLKRVFIANNDPNPLVAGGGIVLLKRARIDVVTGVLADEAAKMNQSFFKIMETGLPYFILKSAQTLDGFAAMENGESKWITSEISRKYVHQLRSVVDAVMVGIGTVLTDDPELNVRMVKGRNPARIIYDSTCSLNNNLNITQSAKKQTTYIVHPESARADYLELLKIKQLISLPYRGDSLEDWIEIWKVLAKEGISSILIEGGPKLHQKMLKMGFADRLLIFTAPKTIGKGICALTFPEGNLLDESPFIHHEWKKSGPDMLFEGIYKEYSTQSRKVVQK